MKFGILGPLEVLNESGAIALGGVKPRAVLAVLLLHANQPVSAERLALALWGEEAPPGSVKTVQVHVSRLRKALGDGNILVTTPAGYCLNVGPGELDAEQFERLVEDGRRMLAAGDPEHAARSLREALELWRGPPLGDLAYEPFAPESIAELEEQHIGAIEERVEADLAAGRQLILVAELQQLVTLHPTRERLAGQLMLALYRCGRQAEALEVYHGARARLDEIGLQPGRQLQRLHEAILRHDIDLELQPAVWELPVQLDAATSPPLVGRDAELAWLGTRLEQVWAGTGALLTITGAPGMGKTRVAAELAGEAHRRGATVLYARGTDPADAVLATFARARQAARATLLVVDDADHAGAEVLAQLQELIPLLAHLPVLVIATGQHPDTTLARLDGDRAITLEPLDAEGVGAIAGRYASGPGAESTPVERLVDASGGVPRRVHELAGDWVRQEAGRRVGAIAGRAATERGELRSTEAALAGNVLELQAVHERIALLEGLETPMVCPFKGLASFGVADAQYFFGRERLVSELVARLVGAPLLGIVGPSGSGKSSVLRAGLLPALSGGVLPGSEDWTQTVMRPGENPLHELRAALRGLGGDRVSVLAVDQLEETFTACRDERQRARFFGELERRARMGDGACVVVLAIRADYYGRCAAYPELASLLAANHVLVGAMGRDELRRAIEYPARRVGMRVEPELVDALVADTENEPGALPLLSAALLELWQRRDGRRLSHADYERTGGVRGSVARLAEEAFRELDPSAQVLARNMVMRLVRVREQGVVERRRVPLEEFATEQGEDVARVVALFTERRLLTASAGTIEVAHEALLREWPRLRAWIEQDREGLRVQQSLTAAAEEWRRVDHDDGALLRGPRLVEAIEWRDSRAPPLNELEREFLAAGEAARARERAMRRRRMQLIGTALATLAAAVVAIVVTVLFAGREHDIAASRDLATESSTLLATDPGLGLAIALDALRRSDTEQAQNAVRQAAFAHRATRVIGAHKNLTFGVAPSPDGRVVATAGGDRSVRIWGVPSGRRVGQIGGYGDEVRAVAFSPDGKLLASAAHDGEIAVAPGRGGRRRVVTRLKGDDFAPSIDFSADGNTLAMGTFGGCVDLVRVGDGAVRRLNSCPGPPVNTVDFAANGQRIVAAGDDGVARIWNVGGGLPLALGRPGKDPAVLAVSFGAADSRVATADVSGHVRIWDTANGRMLTRMRVSDQLLTSVRLSRDGRRIVAGDFNGIIYLVDVRMRAVLAELKGHHGPVRADFVPGSPALVSTGDEDGTLRMWDPPATRLAPRPGTAPLFSPDNRLVVSGDPAGPIHVWAPATGAERELARHKDVSYAQFSPDGKQIVSASHDETVRVWDVKTGQSRLVPTLPGLKFAAAIDASGRRIAIGGTTPLVIQAPDGRARVRLRGHRGYVNALAFSPDSKHLVTGSDDGTVRVWNTRSGALERTLRGHEGIVRGVSYSDDGRRIASAGSDGTVRVWAADGGDPVILVGHEGGVNTARFNGRGDRVVSAGDDGTIRVWDANGGDALLVVYRHRGSASGADFSADGRSIASAGNDGMRITPCDVCGTLDGVLRVARTRAQHELTAAERERLLPGG